MKTEIREDLRKLLRQAIISKIDTYKAETEHKPFFEAIFTREQVLMASVIQSFYTSFGISVYEQISVILAKGAGFHAKRQYDLLGKIDPKTEELINFIHYNLRQGRAPNVLKETEMIRDSIKHEFPHKDPDSVVDVFIKKQDGTEYYIDITSAKPNKKEFVELKRKLLRWKGLRLSQNRSTKIISGIAIPYNPYYPKSYNRWTSENMYHKSELLIGEEFWNFVAGEAVYDDLLKIFIDVGKELRQKIKDMAKR